MWTLELRTQQYRSKFILIVFFSNMQPTPEKLWGSSSMSGKHLIWEHKSFWQKKMSENHIDCHLRDAKLYSRSEKELVSVESGHPWQKKSLSDIVMKAESVKKVIQHHCLCTSRHSTNFVCPPAGRCPHPTDKGKLDNGQSPKCYKLTRP